MIGFLALAMLVGAVTQRITGMGFALLCAPFIVLLLGPEQGVTLSNLCGVAMGGIAVLTARGRLDWGMVGKLSAGAAFGVVAGTVIALTVDRRILMMVIGCIVVMSMAAIAVLSERRSVRLPAQSVYAAGVLSGLFSATSGVGGPPISAWAVTSRATPPNFALSIQPYFALTAGGAVAAKLALGGPNTFPMLTAAEWLVVAGSVAAGWAIGARLQPRLSRVLVRRLLLIIATIGGISLIVGGVAGG